MFPKSFKIIISFCLLSLVSTFPVFGSNTFTEFLKAFKNLEYDKAEKIVLQIDDLELQKVCLSLIDIQKNRGQNPEHLVLKADADDYKGITQVVNYLNKGYYHLYKTPYKAKAYINFQQAYKISNEKYGFSELTKICLLAILDVYAKEVYKANEDCLIYLKILKENSTDFADKYYYNFHILRMFLRGETSGKPPKKKFMEDYIALMDNFDKSHLFFADFHFYIGIFKRFSNQKQEAILSYKKAIAIAKKYTFLKGVQFASLAHLGETHRELGNLKLAKFYLTEAEKNISKIDTLASNYSLNVYKSFYYRDIKDYEEAYELLKKASIQNIKIGYQKNASEISRLNVQYQTEKKEKELLQTRTEKAETELALSKTQNWVYILVTLLALGGGTFFAINQRNKRKAQELVIAEKEKGLQALISAQEEERTKIARELHDGVVQQIGSVILKARNLFTKKDLIQDNESKEVLQRLENSNQDLRNISHQMMPRALKELGVLSALNDLLEGSLSYANIKYSLEHFNIQERLPEKIEVTIYRIVQELINNIIKHSKANEVSVQLFNANNNIILIVEDDGVGFSSTTAKKGIGLLNISSRLDMVNGDVNFEPSPKSGTLVTIKIPLTNL